MVAAVGYSLRRWERALLLIAVFGFHPVITFETGQVPTLLTALLCFAFVAAEIRGRGGSADGLRGRTAPYVSGALTTLGSSMKLHYAPSGAHLLRDRRRLAGALATAAALVVASLAIFGLQVHLHYLDVLAWGKGWGDGPARRTGGGTRRIRDQLARVGRPFRRTVDRPPTVWR